MLEADSVVRFRTAKHGYSTKKLYKFGPTLKKVGRTFIEMNIPEYVLSLPQQAIPMFGDVIVTWANCTKKTPTDYCQELEDGSSGKSTVVQPSSDSLCASNCVEFPLDWVWGVVLASIA